MDYKSKCWPIKKTHVQRLMLAEIRIIRWMCDYMRVDRIRNEVIRSIVKMTPIEDKIRETKLIWFGHLNRRSVNATVRKCERINIPEHRRDK